MMTAASRDSEFPELLSADGWRRIARRHQISDRELSVLRLVCRGLQNDAIAKSLGIQLPTLRTHLRSIYQKLNCKRRTQAVLRVIHGSEWNPHSSK